MKNPLPDSILKKYPQMVQIIEAIEEFKDSKDQSVKCTYCNNLIEIQEDLAIGYLETNCKCGKSKYRMRWDLFD